MERPRFVGMTVGEEETQALEEGVACGVEGILVGGGVTDGGDEEREGFWHCDQSDEEGA